MDSLYNNKFNKFNISNHSHQMHMIHSPLSYQVLPTTSKQLLQTAGLQQNTLHFLIQMITSVQRDEVGSNVPILAGIGSGFQYAGDRFVVLLEIVFQLQTVVRESADHRHELSDVVGNGIDTLDELVLTSDHHLD